MGIDVEMDVAMHEMMVGRMNGRMNVTFFSRKSSYDFDLTLLAAKVWDGCEVLCHNGIRGDGYEDGYL